MKQEIRDRITKKFFEVGVQEGAKETLSFEAQVMKVEDTAQRLVSDCYLKPGPGPEDRRPTVVKVAGVNVARLKNRSVFSYRLTIAKVEGGVLFFFYVAGDPSTCNSGSLSFEDCNSPEELKAALDEFRDGDHFEVAWI